MKKEIINLYENLKNKYDVIPVQPDEIKVSSTGNNELYRESAYFQVLIKTMFLLKSSYCKVIIESRCNL